MNYYTLTADLEDAEDSDSEDPSWFLRTNKHSGAQASSKIPNDQSNLQNAIREYISPETFKDLLNQSESRTEEVKEGSKLEPVVTRRKSTLSATGRRASQRFSRLFEGVASYVVGSSSNLPPTNTTNQSTNQAEKPSKPNHISPACAKSTRNIVTKSNSKKAKMAESGNVEAESDYDSVPCWDPHFLDGSSNLRSENLVTSHQRKYSEGAAVGGAVGGAVAPLDRRRSVPHWVEATAHTHRMKCKDDNVQQMNGKDVTALQMNGKDDIAMKINEIFDSFGLEESDVNTAPNMHRADKGFFQRRKNVVSGYFYDWANTFGLIESDAKSLNSLSTQTSQNGHGSQSGHSRRSSDTSQISVNSGGSGQEGGEEDLWTIWGKIINEWDTFGKKKLPTIKDLVRRGIPHHFRGIAWQVLCGAHDSTEKAKYAEYMKATSACEKVIRRDIARTYPEHDFFKKKDGVGQEALFNVMKAYSIHDREVGYCQGSAFIVGLLLMQMPEEESFAVLVKIMQDYRMREMFKPSMAELGLCMYQMDTLVQEHIPELYVHFQSQAIHTNLYASSWFLTLFTTTLPISLSCRIMDCFLSEGIEVIFRLAITLLLTAKHELLCQDMEGVLKYFQKEMPLKFEADPEIIFSMAFNLKINQKKMKRLEKEYNTMKSKEKEDEIELRRLRTENRLLRQRIDTLENESSELADRLIQGQVNRAEVEETTFAIKRELAAIRQHDFDTNGKLEEAKERIRKLSSLLEDQSSKPSSLEDMSLKSEIIKQKEEMIHCLQDELIKVRLREAENEDLIKKQRERISELEEEGRRSRESIPEAAVASLQEEMAASKLREAEANLALKDLRAKVGELNLMWQKHLKRAETPKEVGEVPSTPKKLLGSLLEGKSEAARLEEELMSSRLKEVECMAELKELRLKLMDLETQREVWNNQVRRQGEEGRRLQDQLDLANKNIAILNTQLRASQRRFTDLEGKLKEDLMMARIRDAENTQCVAELTQKISNLEYKNQELVTEGDLITSIDESDRVREMQDKVACLRAQVTRLALMNSKLTQSLSMHNLAASFGSDSDTSVSTPRQSPGTSPSRSSLSLDLSNFSFSTLSLNRTLSNS